MTKDNGGPAFPIETTATPYAPGMTLRDWFAGQAPDMPEWWVSSVAHKMEIPRGEAATVDWLIHRLACWRWAYADAMLAARQGGEA